MYRANNYFKCKLKRYTHSLPNSLQGYSYLVWGGIALHYMSIYINLNKQKKLNDFLLAVVK